MDTPICSFIDHYGKCGEPVPYPYFYRNGYLCKGYKRKDGSNSMVQNKQYTVHIIGVRAICPICSGAALLISKDGKIWCKDCCTIFKIVDFGRNDKEMICEVEK